MAKGGAYEREISKQLSLWWTELERDDCFWRSSNSGGRATIRGKKGEKTAGHYGDIVATNEIGKPLTDLITIEVKRGYSKHSIAELLDSLPNRKPSMFEQWIDQADKARLLSGAACWILIHRRDSRKAMVYIPKSYCLFMVGSIEALEVVRPFLTLSFFRKEGGNRIPTEIYGMRLKDFFYIVRPARIKELQRSDDYV